MKKITLTSLALVLLSGISCTKFLDKNPDNRSELKTLATISQLLATAYPQAPYCPLGEMYSDNVSDKGPNASGVHVNLPFPDLYFFKDIESDDYNTPTIFWNGTYAGIAAANQALESIAENKLGPEANYLKGEALLARAFGHFLLVTFFAKAYEPGGDNSSMGIPYVLSVEDSPFKKYSRGTVASVYQQIEKDITEGIPLLQGGHWEVPGYHFTPAAAHAFAARFYLFKAEWQKVIDHANQTVINGDFTGNLRDYAGAALDWTSNYENYGNYFCRGDAKFNLLVHEMKSTYQRADYFYTSRYGFGPAIYTKFFEAENVTGRPFRPQSIEYGFGNYSLEKLRNSFVVFNATAQIGYPFIQLPLLTTDEALLNRAEAFVQLGNMDAAIEDFNLAARYKMSGYNLARDGVTLAKATAFYKVEEKQAMLNAVLDMKRWTFMNEGMRYFDIIRHKLPVTHLVIDNNNVESTLVLEPDDKRRVFQIPTVARVVGELEPNPR